ncbi:MAG: response regulator transcription factor [Bdellovibrionota bacterium]
MSEKKAKILLVEDEKNVGSTLTERLNRENYEVTWSQTKEDALLQLSQRKFNLFLLDIGLPDGSGFDVAKECRKTQPSAAVVFLTAFTSPDDRVHGLELGAEDYIPKPFHLKELILRIQNALKRAKYVSEAIDDDAPLTIGQASFHFSKFEATSGGKIHSLTHKEAALLKLLLERKGAVVSRDEILNHVWSEDEFPSSRTVDNFILRLRRIIEKDPENPQVIKSVRGVGYQIHVV